MRHRLGPYPGHDPSLVQCALVAEVSAILILREGRQLSRSFSQVKVFRAASPPPPNLAGLPHRLLFKLIFSTNPEEKSELHSKAPIPRIPIHFNHKDEYK